MAVLGGKQYNKDPRVLTRSSSYLTAFYIVAIDGTDRNSNNGNFWSNYGIFQDAKTTTAYSANTAKQIVSISGSSGFFYGAMSPSLADVTAYVTWTIVVDGVSYSIVQGAGTKDDGETRFCLGSIFQNYQFSGSLYYKGGLQTAQSDPTWDSAHGSINKNYGSSTAGINLGMPDMTGDEDQKVFFANSLVVSCTPTHAQSSSFNEHSGVIYRIL